MPYLHIKIIPLYVICLEDSVVFSPVFFHCFLQCLTQQSVINSFALDNIVSVPAFPFAWILSFSLGYALIHLRTQLKCQSFGQPPRMHRPN